MRKSGRVEEWKRRGGSLTGQGIAGAVCKPVEGREGKGGPHPGSWSRGWVVVVVGSVVVGAARVRCSEQ